MQQRLALHNMSSRYIKMAESGLKSCERKVSLAEQYRVTAMQNAPSCGRAAG